MAAGSVVVENKIFNRTRTIAWEWTSDASELVIANAGNAQSGTFILHIWKERR